MKRMIFLSSVKEECVDEYKRYHADVWPELEAAYKQAGIMKVSCFLNGRQLLVYSEYDETVFTDEAKEKLMQKDAEIRWQTVMGPLMDQDVPRVEYEEVYRMN